jgi:hypothetical protein
MPALAHWMSPLGTSSALPGPFAQTVNDSSVRATAAETTTIVIRFFMTSSSVGAGSARRWIPTI